MLRELRYILKIGSIYRYKGLIFDIYRSYWDTVAAKQPKYIPMLVQKAYNKLRVHLMICKNINDILTFNKNETKFRHCRCNWVDMRRFVSGIRELPASMTKQCIIKIYYSRKINGLF